jgi:lipid-binding SYLF domain-containing protein
MRRRLPVRRIRTRTAIEQESDNYQEQEMRKSRFATVFGTACLLCATATLAASYGETITLFKNAGESAAFFNDSYGYAVFPTVGKGGFVVGGAHGHGHVYVHGKYAGDTSMNQVSVGFQAGGQAYSQIIFFENKAAFDDFSKGNFEFGADVNAVAITAAAGGSVGTTGANAEASGGMKDARTAGHYYKGYAVFTIVKGGAMYQATVAGQKFSYTPKA